MQEFVLYLTKILHLFRIICRLYVVLFEYSQERPGADKNPMPIKRLKITYHGDTFKRALFDEPAPVMRQSGGSSQKTTNTSLTASSSKAPRDIFDIKWTFLYEESERRLYLC